MSGVSGHWSHAEDDRLHELPWLAQLLYLRGLRRFVDRDTGIAGERRRVSYRGLVETLTVPSARGRHAAHEAAPTVSAVRHALRLLERAGLVVPVSERDGALVFRLPCALQGQSVRRMSDTMSSGMNVAMSDRDKEVGKPSPDAGLGECDSSMSDSMSDTMSVAMSDTHQSKAIPLGNDNSACSPTSRSRDSGAAHALALAMRLRREAGMLDAHPQRPELVGLVRDGFEVEAVVVTACELRTRGRVPNVGYLAATVRGRREDALRNETGVNYGYAIGGGARRGSVCDAIEEQDREASARERRERMHVVR